MRTGPWINLVNALREGEPIVSTLEMARSQTLCINGAHESCPEVSDFPKESVKQQKKGEHTFRVVDGLENLLHHSADEGQLFSELGAPWAVSSEAFSMSGYKHFPAGEA